MRKRHRSLSTLFLFVCAWSVGMAFALPTSAQEKSTSPAQQKKERRTNLNFEDEMVEGGTNKPELFYLFQKKNFNYKRLIRMRENFLPEMRKTSEDIQRNRSSN